MTVNSSNWTIIVSFISLILFIVWGAYEYLTNPAEVPMEPIVMSIIALMGLFGACLYQASPRAQAKNVINKTVKAKGDVIIGDEGMNDSSEFNVKNYINAPITSTEGAVRIGDSTESKH